MPVMTPDHERWEEFCVRLEGPEGCDVRRDELNYNTGRCTGLENKPFARAILASMGLTCTGVWWYNGPTSWQRQSQAVCVSVDRQRALFTFSPGNGLCLLCHEDTATAGAALCSGPR